MKAKGYVETGSSREKETSMFHISNRKGKSPQKQMNTHDDVSCKQ